MSRSLRAVFRIIVLLVVAWFTSFAAANTIPVTAEAAASGPADSRTTKVVIRPEPADMGAELMGSGIYAHEPIYIVGGGKPETDVRLQFSFKARLFSRFYLGYTQNSHWDISGPSAPFRDTTYNPSLFVYQPLDDPKSEQDRTSFHMSGGYEHASNGRDGADSRSMDTVFFKLVGIYRLSNTLEMRIGAKVFHYLKTSGNNVDIKNYRQNLDLEYGFFDRNTFGFSIMYRHGKSGKGSIQVDATYALCELRLLRDWPGFLHVQTFSGYGETLADYNARKPTQLRIGYMLERVSGRTRGDGCAS